MKLSRVTAGLVLASPLVVTAVVLAATSGVSFLAQAGGPSPVILENRAAIAPVGLSCSTPDNCKVTTNHQPTNYSNPPGTFVDCDNDSCSAKTLTGVVGDDGTNYTVISNISCPQPDRCRAVLTGGVQAYFLSCSDETCATRTILPLNQIVIRSATDASQMDDDPHDAPRIECSRPDRCKILFHEETNWGLPTYFVDCNNDTCSTFTKTLIVKFDGGTGGTSTIWSALSCPSSDSCKILYAAVSGVSYDSQGPIRLRLVSCNGETCAQHRDTVIATGTTSATFMQFDQYNKGGDIFCDSVVSCSIVASVEGYMAGLPASTPTTKFYHVTCSDADCEYPTVRSSPLCMPASNPVSLSCPSPDNCKILTTNAVSAPNTVGNGLFFIDCQDDTCSTYQWRKVDASSFTLPPTEFALDCPAGNSCRMAWDPGHFSLNAPKPISFLACSDETCGTPASGAMCTSPGGSSSSVGATSSGGVSSTGGSSSGGPIQCTPNFSDYTNPRASTTPQRITIGSDGNVWFTEGSDLANDTSTRIGMMTPSGAFTEYLLPGPSNIPGAIVTGPDGDIWFTEPRRTQIGRIYVHTGNMQHYGVGSAPGAMVLGPDDALWYTENSANKIGRITTGLEITEYDIPTPNSGPNSITLGPDGNLWFIESSANKIGKITIDGDVTEYDIPNSNVRPDAIMTGPDGNLWFTQNYDPFNPVIWQMTVDGDFTDFPVRNSIGRMTAGPDGNVWFTEPQANQIGRITPDGDVEEFLVPALANYPAHPFDITLNTATNVFYFTEQGNGRIGYITGCGTVGASSSVTSSRQSSIISSANVSSGPFACATGGLCSKEIVNGLCQGVDSPGCPAGKHWVTGTVSCGTVACSGKCDVGCVADVSSGASSSGQSSSGQASSHPVCAACAQACASPVATNVKPSVFARFWSALTGAPLTAQVGGSANLTISANNGNCIDSDGGINPLVAGETRDSAGKRNADYCNDPFVVAEFTCPADQNGAPNAVMGVPCPVGTRCNAGACKAIPGWTPPQNPTCTELDGGADVYMRATTRGDKVQTDSCDSATYIREYYCAQATSTTVVNNAMVVECPDGGSCENGECVAGTDAGKWACDKCLSESCPAGDSCAPICGDGLRIAWEQCDDGNTVDGDGCSSTCMKQALRFGSSSSSHQPTHLACDASQCVVVSGTGQDQCGVDPDCTRTEHLACTAPGACTKVQGPGVDLCATGGQCDQMHLTCVGLTCQGVPGSGGDNCNSDFDCKESSSSSSSSSFDGCPANVCKDGGDDYCDIQHKTCEAAPWPDCIQCKGDNDYDCNVNNECALGGDPYCANQGKKCVEIPDGLCIECDADFVCPENGCFSGGEELCSNSGKQCTATAAPQCVACGPLPMPACQGNECATVGETYCEEIGKLSGKDLVCKQVPSDLCIECVERQDVPPVCRGGGCEDGGDQVCGFRGKTCTDVSSGMCIECSGDDGTLAAPYVCQSNECRTGGGAKYCDGLDRGCRNIPTGLCFECKSSKGCKDSSECAFGSQCVEGSCVRFCGNGKIDAGESCDGGAGCTEDCLLAVNQQCTFDTECATGRCQNSLCNICEDGGDCQSGQCNGGACLILCGNGQLDPGEICDPGPAGGNETCTGNCLLAQGGQCEQDTQCQTGFCQDATCIGCSRGSQCQSGICVSGSCVDLCGNGRQELLEACDDGNRITGDGCSRFCELEGSGPLPTVASQLLPVSLIGDRGPDVRGTSGESDIDLPGDQLAAAVNGHAAAGETGPAALIAIAGGAASGWAWMRSKRKKVSGK